MPDISADIVNKSAYTAVACAAATNNPRGILTAATVLNVVRSAQATNTVVTPADLSSILTDRLEEYDRRVEHAKGNVLAGSVIQSIATWVSAAGSNIAPIAGPYAPYFNKTASASSLFLSIYQPIMREVNGPQIQGKASYSLGMENKFLLKGCERIYGEIYELSKGNHEYQNLFTQALALEGIAADPSYSALDNLRFNPTLLKSEQLMAVIGHDGTISSDRIDNLKQDVEKRLEDSRQVLKDVIEGINNIGYSTNSLTELIQRQNLDAAAKLELETRLQIAEKKAEEEEAFNQLKLNSARSSIYLVGTLIGGSTGQDIQKVGNAVIDIVETTSKFCTGLQKLSTMGGALSAVVFSGNVVGIVASLFSGPSTEQQILEQVREIRKDIAALRGIMIEGFRAIDNKLADMHQDLILGIDALSLQHTITHAQIKEVQQQTDRIFAYISMLLPKIEIYFAESSLQPYKQAILTANDFGWAYRFNSLSHIDQDKFTEFLMNFRNLASQVSRETVHISNQDSGFDARSERLWSWTGTILEKFPNLVNDQSRTKIANLVVWQMGAEAMIRLVGDFDEPDSNNRILIKQQCAAVIETGKELQEILSSAAFDSSGTARVDWLNQYFGNFMRALDHIKSEMLFRLTSFQNQLSGSLGNGIRIRIFEPLSYSEWTFTDTRFLYGAPKTILNYFPGNEVESALMLGLATIRTYIDDHRFVDKRWTYKNSFKWSMVNGQQKQIPTKVKEKLHGCASATLHVEIKIADKWHKLVKLRLKSAESSWLPKEFEDNDLTPAQRNLAISEFELFYERDIKQNLVVYANELGVSEKEEALRLCREELSRFFVAQQKRFYLELASAFESIGLELYKTRQELEYAIAIALPNAFQSECITSMFRGPVRLVTPAEIQTLLLSMAETLTQPEQKFLTKWQELIERCNSYNNILISNVLPTLSPEGEENHTLKEILTQLDLIDQAFS